MNKKIYIAYGMNMDRQGMAKRCPNCEFVDVGYLFDYELIFKGCASIRKSRNSKVPVVIYHISDIDEYYLDLLEGYPYYYDKTEVDVESFNNGKLKGMVYIMNEDYSEGTPFEEYFNGIKKSYKEFGFNEYILDNAYKNSQKKLKDR